jgi:alkylhydroperoxidase family enzyme
MLEYAVKLTRSPHSIEESDIEALRGAGFDEAGILDICQVASYYNYVNRLADGLGVELEPYWTDDQLTLTESEFHSRVDAGDDSP